MFIIYMHTVYLKSIPAISTMNLQLSLPYLLEATNSISPMSALFTFSSFSVCWSSSGIVISYRPGLLARTTPLLGTKAFSVRSDTYRKEGSRVSLSQDITIDFFNCSGILDNHWELSSCLFAYCHTVFMLPSNSTYILLCTKSERGQTTLDSLM